MSLLGYLILTYANLNATTQFKMFDICKLFVRICDSFSLEMENKCALIHKVLTPADFNPLIRPCSGVIVYPVWCIFLWYVLFA